MKYQNPILKGMYPDPSICRAGDDYYIVNSTFEFFPAVPVWHSKDLINWEQIGHCISRYDQLGLVPCDRQSASGIYAPSIRYKDGIFYMVTTNMVPDDGDAGNFYVWTKDPAGEWSDPIFLDSPGIDPSFFFDDDGRNYYVGTGNNKIYLSEIDFAEGKLIGEVSVLWEGTGGAYPEGPHLFKKNGWYYLMISEGGTERSHMITMARSKSLRSDYEVCPNNPVLTNRSLLRPIESVGHADLVEDANGNWWAVCLGTRTFSYPPKHNLGRETMLIPVDWSGDWPVFGHDGHLDREYDTPKLPGNVPQKPLSKSYGCGPNQNGSFKDLCWNHLYNPIPKQYEITDDYVKLKGNECNMYDRACYAWYGIRQYAHETHVGVSLTFPALNEGEEAGFTVFMNHKHHYAASLIMENGTRKVIFYRRIGSLMAREYEAVVDTDKVFFEIESDKDFYTFYYTIDGALSSGRVLIGRGETVYLTTEVGGSFTGNYFAMFAMGNGNKCETTAVFSDFVCEPGL